MDLYSKTCYELSEYMTKSYSTSFTMSSRLFDTSIRKYIYAIYGLVRIADEIVDTYKGTDAEKQIDLLESETKHACRVGYSTNPLVHAFAETANAFAIGNDLLEPFFDSMRMDLNHITFDIKTYNKYIYGSAEVIGLMCLRVFVYGDNVLYQSLKEGASALGAAYQKVNFLRDMNADYILLGRVYFPNVTYETFNEHEKNEIIKDIEADFEKANSAIYSLPKNARKAVRASYYYYYELLQKLKNTPVDEILAHRMRVSDIHKITLLLKAMVGS